MKLKTKSCPACKGTGKINADTALGPKLRMERLRQRVRAYQVARALGMDNATVCRIEAGKNLGRLTEDTVVRWRQAIADLARVADPTAP